MSRPWQFSADSWQDFKPRPCRGQKVRLFVFAIFAPANPFGIHPANPRAETNLTGA